MTPVLSKFKFNKFNKFSKITEIEKTGQGTLNIDYVPNNGIMLAKIVYFELKNSVLRSQRALEIS